MRPSVQFRFEILLVAVGWMSWLGLVTLIAVSAGLLSWEPLVVLLRPVGSFFPIIFLFCGFCFAALGGLIAMFGWRDASATALLATVMGILGGAILCCWLCWLWFTSWTF